MRICMLPSQFQSHTIQIVPEHGGWGISVDREPYTRVIRDDVNEALRYGLDLARQMAGVVVLHRNDKVEVYS